MNEKVIAPKDVLDKLMLDGSFDRLRSTVLSELKVNEELRKHTSRLVEKSETLNSADALHRNRRDLFDALRKELETDVVERASKIAWEIILNNEGVGLDISKQVEQVFFELNDWPWPSQEPGYPSISLIPTPKPEDMIKPTPPVKDLKPVAPVFSTKEPVAPGLAGASPDSEPAVPGLEPTVPGMEACAPGSESSAERNNNAGFQQQVFIPPFFKRDEDSSKDHPVSKSFHPSSSPLDKSKDSSLQHVNQPGEKSSSASKPAEPFEASQTKPTGFQSSSNSGSDHTKSATNHFDFLNENIPPGSTKPWNSEPFKNDNFMPPHLYPMAQMMPHQFNPMLTHNTFHPIPPHFPNQMPPPNPNPKPMQMPPLTPPGQMPPPNPNLNPNLNPSQMQPLTPPGQMPPPNPNLNPNLNPSQMQPLTPPGQMHPSTINPSVQTPPVLPPGYNPPGQMHPPNPNAPRPPFSAPPYPSQPYPYPRPAVPYRGQPPFAVHPPSYPHYPSQFAPMGQGPNQPVLTRPPFNPYPRPFPPPQVSSKPYPNPNSTGESK